MPSDEECIVGRKHPVVENRKGRLELRRSRRYFQKRTLLRERDERAPAVDERQIYKGLSNGRLGKRNAAQHGAGGGQKTRSVQEQTPFSSASQGNRLKMTLVVFLEVGAPSLLERLSLGGAVMQSLAGTGMAVFHGQGQLWGQLSELALAFVLSALIGLEREYRQKSAGLRTYTVVGLGAALIMLVSKYGFFDVLQDGRVIVDPSRVAAQIVTGIGFIGGCDLHASGPGSRTDHSRYCVADRSRWDGMRCWFTYPRYCRDRSTLRSRVRVSTVCSNDSKGGLYGGASATRVQGRPGYATTIP
jgi:hypothetical protein